MAVSNEKASVTKEQNDKNRKVLEALMKRPENKECADCRSKGPRWASVNLGIFVCIQCSGIHRSLGVDISKVRSVTLDTWLPEQVAFMQSTGNEKANQRWEADLPPNFKRPGENDRSGLETFIRAKYEAKRWVERSHRSPQREERRSFRDERRSSREGMSRRAAAENDRDSKAGVERHGKLGKEVGERYDGHRERRASDLSSDGSDASDRREASRTTQSSTQHAGASSSSSPLPNGVISSVPRIPFSATSGSQISKGESSTSVPVLKRPQGPPSSLSAASQPPQKVEAESNLFDLLSIHDNVSGAPATSSSPAGDDSWTTFQSAESIASAAAAKASPPGSGQSSEPNSGASARNSATAGLEELFTVPPEGTKKPDVPTTPPPPSKDVRQSILSLFETPSSSPYLAQQQQMAALAEYQSKLMNAALAEHQSKLMNAVPAVAGLQGMYYEEGHQQANLLKNETLNPAINQGGAGAQVRPVGVPVPGSMFNPMGFPNRGSPLLPESSPFHVQGHAGSASLYNSPAAGPALSYGAQGRSAPYGNGLFSSDELNTAAGTSSTSRSSASQPLTTTGNGYDFSALTANAFSKH